ncbi:copper-resistance protein, CopA family [Desulfuromonas soudanensis]|uniref:Copper-resistance protein, CopA family n=1 Tax=Desulfuromonas soudanensis TaxID=1603606 RepID=A0A0M4D6M6_9BACT|nr:copper resistance system multicopper oxidase [Desulfuromonas soudanensis]ALC16635.1 copper-resistance protein, CopA family [Desulfuromonas soudanensis]
MNSFPTPLDSLANRRQFLRYISATGLLATLDGLLPAWAREPAGLATGPAARAPGEPIDLFLRWQDLAFGGRRGRAITLNGTVPGPLLRLREGEDATIRVHNELGEDSSVHWHGILVPFEMDGVPGVSFPGIRAGETFTYRFPVRQSGTYWYHSHSGLQEQLGHYGPLIIDPAEPEPYRYDREYVVMLSDWTFENPYKVLAKLKKLSAYYNFQQRTVGDFFRDMSEDGLALTVKERLAWGNMRMSPTDIADITGYTYTYLVNGLAPGDNWTGLFAPGERVRLRLINAATMSYFNVRIPGLPMTVVQADGQDVQPVETDELQIAVAETFDVIVHPREDRAYTLFAEAMDRSGFGRGTLAPRPGMTAPVPGLRERPLRTMVDMGMDMSAMGSMRGMEMGGGKMPSGAADHGDHPGQMTGMAMGEGEQACVPGMTPCTGPEVGRHGPDTHGPGNTSVARVQRDRLGEPGTGLEQVGHRVLVYTDLRRLADDFDERPADREMELHLTGNMERYMWSFDGKKFSEVQGPIKFNYGERLRLTMVNDTMMEHPIHLHGMWMELENGHGRRIPRKHTISVKPAERLSVLIAVDAPGRWAFHCHLLYHMDMGMFRVVRVS